MLVTVEIVGRDDHFVDVKEGDIDQFAIRGRGAGSAAIEPMNAFKGGLNNCLSPENLSGLPVETQEDAILGLLAGADGKDAITPDDGGGVAVARKGRLPSDVVGGAPSGRDVLLGTRAVESRAAPRRPVLGHGR